MDDLKLNITYHISHSLGKFIALKRAEIGMKQKYLAKQLDVSCAYMNAIENDRRSLIPKRLKQIADILHLDDTDEKILYDLAAEQDNSLPLDILDYARSDYIVEALRLAQTLGADEKDWAKFMNILHEKKG